MTAIEASSCLVLFTKNGAGKAQAGRFAADNIERAQAAATKLGLSCVPFGEGGDADLLAALPPGRFGENDRPLLANIKTDIFKRLSLMAEALGSGDDDHQEAETEENVTAENKDSGKPAAASGAVKGKKAAPMLSIKSDAASGDTTIGVVMKEGGTHWPQLTKGDVVLAPDFSEGEYGGWWEAVVRARSDSHVTLDWRDYPDFPPFTRQITQIAPLHPDCVINA
ncbi:hypothetical protein [Xanthobacter pseudotagetidis]|uniref:hypothetical protein n=1 Tax=Xanthobacter pseudotagetidis TaxID=3119911 RepID=UPI0037263563